MGDHETSPASCLFFYLSPPESQAIRKLPLSKWLNRLQPNASRRSGYPPASPPSTESRSARPPIPVFPLDGSNPLQPPKSSVFLSFRLHAISHRRRTIHLDRFYKMPNSENFGPREAPFPEEKSVSNPRRLQNQENRARNSFVV